MEKSEMDPHAQARFLQSQVFPQESTPAESAREVEPIGKRSHSVPMSPVEGDSKATTYGKHQTPLDV